MEKLRGSATFPRTKSHHHKPTSIMLALSSATFAFAPASPVARPAVRGLRPVMQEAAAVEEPPAPVFDVKKMAGVTDPLGFFDPIGFCDDASEGKIRFYREVELKHGRVAMLASLGYLIGEQFHPLWGGSIDVPSFVAFQATPLQTFWPAVVLFISVIEVFSVFSFNTPLGGEPWSVRADHAPGDFGFDPMGLKPTNEAELKEMQTKELNNGRLAMFAIAGMVGQEAATGGKLF
tara:strand:- start:53 stop:754 length:702 start_codon:yes stop_codon:yes gene_type:complete